MKIYLAGPMRGHSELNRPAFNQYAGQLRAEGHEVFNPAEMPDADCLALRAIFDLECSYICREAEAVAVMPGWEHSKGAMAEKSLADAIGVNVIYLGAIGGIL